MVDAAKRPRDGSDGDAAQKIQKGGAIDLTVDASSREAKSRTAEASMDQLRAERAAALEVCEENCMARDAAVAACSAAVALASQTQWRVEQLERGQEAMQSIAREFICPITHELPIAPVMADDGKIYEEKAIREWFSKKDGEPTSPSTGAVIGTKLLPAPQARNTIEALIQSGAIDGEIAEVWKQKLADEKEVKETRAKAEGGDAEAMWWLGVSYENGECGLAIDEAQARAWYERSAAARHPKGMGTFGEYLLLGIGGPRDNALGLVNVTAAAELGSSLGAYYLGWAFFKGKYGLPKDPARARFWLKKAAEGECKYKHLTDEAIAEAAKWLGELDQ